MAIPRNPFLGIGWSFPPTFSRQEWGVEMVAGARDIRESLWILFSTSLGERVMVPEYGTQLDLMVFRNLNTGLLTRLEDMVRTAILLWEPRIDVERIEVRPDASVDGLVHIDVAYAIVQTNTRNNFVYPFYLKEATIPMKAE